MEQTVDLDDHLNHFVKIKLNDVEDDLTVDDWTLVINEMVSNFQSSCLFGITDTDIKHFKKDMFNENNFSLRKLKNSLRKHFAIGHFGIARTLMNVEQVYDIILTKHPEKTQCQFNIEGYKGSQIAYIYNPKAIDYKGIQEFNEKQKKITLNILKTQYKDIPLIKIPSFRGRGGKFIQEIDSVVKKINQNYDDLILDLRGNQGGLIISTYYFLSLFLGNNDPDIRPVEIVPEMFKSEPQKLENILKTFPFGPFYKDIHFDSEKCSIEKDTSEQLKFKRMVVLIDRKTFSGGEIAAATLKSTLGSKVCILGMATKGSFEQADEYLNMSHKFRLYLPKPDKVFYSVKFKKLLTGQRLLPDYEHVDMSSIIERALEMLNDSIHYPDSPSFESMKNPQK